VLRRARLICVRGTVQGVGFRPFAYRLAQKHRLAGWVTNDSAGVEIHVEGVPSALDAFARALEAQAPPAARIASLDVRDTACLGFERFAIRTSERSRGPTVQIAPDLPVCGDCLRELFDPTDRRYRYPYINCTNCGPRYSIVLALPYDRVSTTMAPWHMCAACAAEYDDPANRRFHAQPVACPACGPTFVLEMGNADRARGYDAIVACAKLLRDGAIVALKGIGGYHLACDAGRAQSVRALRERKFRKERPFAVMVRDVAPAHEVVVLDEAARALLGSSARPIVLADARCTLEGVAPGNRELGVLLPYTPLHHLLFAAGAPSRLVVTSANRSSEPIAFDDDDARRTLGGIADAFLVGERAIARRIDDSVARACAGAPAVLRRARGYAPQPVARFPRGRPILALGGDLKNAIALVVDGEAYVSQHVGDLEHLSARAAHVATIRDLCAMYEVDPAGLLVVHDAHPGYASAAMAIEYGAHVFPVQHHRAHIASVLAERDAWTTDVVGLAFDGTGYGDDGTIWGGEMFDGNLRDGFVRRAHLRRALLPGGDAAAAFPVQAAAGFLAALEAGPDVMAPPFALGERYRAAQRVIQSGVRCFSTTSMGRLFDTVAALLGFTYATSFEGQAAMWLEHLASEADTFAAYPFPLLAGELDYRPLLEAILEDRCARRNRSEIARGFHVAVADAIVVASAHSVAPVVCSGGVFQNRLLVELVRERLGSRAWFNAAVPPNDGGLCLGQAALAVARSTH
jgi:hydrogenase maturation protein HypF